MQTRNAAILSLGLLLAASAVAKNKSEKPFPDYILRAKTVAVIVDPSAGMSVDDPQANQVARRDVEKALQSWGRFQPVVTTQGADLIIVVRRGHAQVVDDTITDPRQNSRPGDIIPTDNGIGVGAQQGRSPGGSSGGIPNTGPMGAQGPAHPQVEVGATDDTFLVYKGDNLDPLDGPVGWRYMSKDALRPHSVPAVEEFRKAYAAADKAAAAAASKNP
jgi:hypothetical protein